MIYSENNGWYGAWRRNYDVTPDKEAAIIGENRATFREVIERGEHIAAGLYDIGVRQGDRVGILLPNSMNLIYSMCGAFRLGAIPVPFDPQLGEYEMKVLFNHIGIRVVILAPQIGGAKHLASVRKIRPMLYDLRKIVVDGECVEDHYQLSFDTLLSADTSMLKKLRVQVGPEDTNFLACTSGSTGMPKVVDIPYSEWEISAEAKLAESYYGFNSDDTFLLGMPMYHFGGFTLGNMCLTAGGKVIYKERFSPVDFLETVATEKVTMLLLTPTLATILLSTPNFQQYDISSLRKIMFAGEYLPDDLAYRLRDEYHLSVINLLGMTEVGGHLIWHSDRDIDVSPNVYVLSPSHEIKIINEEGNPCEIGEDGVILIRGPVMKGYYRSEELTRQVMDDEGWINTGDMGSMCPDGRIRFRGREKNIVKRGANLVYPEDIAAFLRTHPDIEVVAVVGEPTEVYGEKIVAYIQPRAGAQITRGDVLEYCRGQISAYKIPDEVNIVSEIPIKYGKIATRKLRDAAGSSEEK